MRLSLAVLGVLGLAEAFLHRSYITRPTHVHRALASTLTPPTTAAEWERAAHGLTLVIVESPAKAKTIQKFLDPSQFIVDFSAGHVRDLPSSSKGMPDKYKKLVVLPSINLYAGHLGVDVFNDFEPLYVPLPGKEEILRRLTERAGQCSRILLASDEDREGEAIAWHLQQTLNSRVPTKRAVFHEITKEAILQSFANPRDIDMNLVHSQETRRILDRLAGYTVSPLLWRFVSYGLSAGRVQSCGLYQIAKRERLRWGFKESQYFSIYGNFASADGSERVSRARLVAVDGRRIANEQDFDSSTGALSKNSSSVAVLDKAGAKQVLDWLSGTSGSPPSFSVASVDTRNVTRRPPPPFITSTLQQEASRKLGLSPSRTMSIAQALYEEGFITYMRTDSPFLSAPARAVASTLVTAAYGEAYLSDPTTAGGEKKTVSRGKKSKQAESTLAPQNAQEAHEAIRPAELDGSFRRPEETGLAGPSKLLYSLVYRRTLASVMAPAQSQTVTYTIDGAGASVGRASFRSSHTALLFPGFLAAASDEPSSGSVSTQRFAKGDAVFVSGDADQAEGAALQDPDEEGEEDGAEEGGAEAMFEGAHVGLTGVQHTTRAPSRFTEASFIKELEAIGVGRPSTYSKILSLLKERDYIIIDRQTIVPSVKGLIVVNMLEKHFHELVEAEFTASMEKMLDSIAHGTQDKLAFLKKFYLGSGNATSDPSLESVGLLEKVAFKMANQEFDHRESRILELPVLGDLGRIKLGSGAVYVEKKPTGLSESAAGADKADISARPTRWVLPEEMQIDIRQISRESIERLMKTEADTGGFAKGLDPASGKPVSIRSGRFGKYAQIGLDDDKAKRTVSLPTWLDGSSSLEDVMDFAGLPKSVGDYPALNSTVMIEVSSKSLCAGVKGFPLRAALPDGVLPSLVTLEMCLEALPDPKEIRESCRVLGTWNEEEMTIRKGRFGFYARCGSTIAGLGKLDPSVVTCEEAGALIDRKRIREKSGKGKKSSKAKTAKSKVAKERAARGATVKAKSAYQLYVSESSKAGVRLAAAAIAWKGLDEAVKLEYKRKAAANVPPSAIEVPLAPKPTRRRSAYQLFVSASMKGGSSLGAAASTWKSLDAASKSVYVKESETEGAQRALKPKAPSARSAYQLFVSESIKAGLRMGEAAGAWRALGDVAKDELKQRALAPAALGGSGQPERTADAPKRKRTAYQLFVSEAIKNGDKLAVAASKWRTLDDAGRSRYAQLVVDA